MEADDVGERLIGELLDGIGVLTTVAADNAIAALQALRSCSPVPHPKSEQGQHVGENMPLVQAVVARSTYR